MSKSKAIYGGFSTPKVYRIMQILNNYKDYIITTYLLAFIHAGASIFNQIEDWPIMKSLLCHFLTLYFAYILCYLINSWIDFNFIAILIFTAVFIAIYFVERVSQER